jgi:hypothetical protein
MRREVSPPYLPSSLLLNTNFTTTASGARLHFANQDVRPTLWYCLSASAAHPGHTPPISCYTHSHADAASFPNKPTRLQPASCSTQCTRSCSPGSRDSCLTVDDAGFGWRLRSPLTSPIRPSRRAWQPHAAFAPKGGAQFTEWSSLRYSIMGARHSTLSTSDARLVLSSAAYSLSFHVSWT